MVFFIGKCWRCHRRDMLDPFHSLPVDPSLHSATTSTLVLPHDFWGFWSSLASHLVGKYIICDSRSLPPIYTGLAQKFEKLLHPQCFGFSRKLRTLSSPQPFTHVFFTKASNKIRLRIMSFNLGLNIYIPFNQGMNSQGSKNYTPFNWHKTGGLDWWPSFFMCFFVF